MDSQPSDGSPLSCVFFEQVEFAPLIDRVERVFDGFERPRVVELDERESGLRAILNLGHTFGHAIETVMGYGKWLHGEAVATGMMMAIDLSIREGLIEEDVRQRGLALLHHMNYIKARNTFLQATDIDAECAIAYWGAFE